MNKLELSCPKAYYDAAMRIRCQQNDDLCAHQRYLICKGWCVLTDQAGRCPVRRDDEHGKDHETAENGGD